ncbi:hypothetical protein PG994_005805 [Apiospora phragmitis]|uniref:Uncharacterized protein n=1 Tax=Apiospora phragmitis TaxID=2905665 RepID=A0ABR1VD86_9PEZI
MPVGTDTSSRSSIGPKTRSILAWAAGGRPAPKKSSHRPSTSLAGREDLDAEPSGHHYRHRHRHASSANHKHSSSSGERKSSSGHKSHSSSSHHHHPRHSSSSHHKSSSSSKSSGKHRPGYYTSYSTAPSGPRDAKSTFTADASSTEPPPVPYRSNFVPPSTAPTIIPEEEDYGQEIIDTRSSVGPWHSISVAGLDQIQYNAYLAAASEKYKEPPGEAAEPDPAPTYYTDKSRGDYGSSSFYSSSMAPPPQYKSGADVPWLEDSAYYSGTGSFAATKLSSSKLKRSLPAYTSHDYVQQQQQQEQPVVSYTAVEPQPACTMNSAYATMPGYDEGYDDSGYGYEEGHYGAVGSGSGGYGDVVEENDRMAFEYEEEGERRRVRATRERTVKRPSRRIH